MGFGRKYKWYDKKESDAKKNESPDRKNKAKTLIDSFSKPKMTKEDLLAKLSEATSARMQGVPTRESLGLLPALQSRFQPNLSPLTQNRFQPTMPQIPQFSARENIRIPETPNFARTQSGAPSGGSALGLLASDKKMPSLNPTVMQAIQQGVSPSQLKARQQQAPQAGNLMALLASGQANNPTVLKAKA